jgi:GTPase
VPISARTREGFDRLHAAASDALSRSFADLDVETSVANGRMLAYLSAHGEVLERQYDGDRVLIHVRLPQRHLGPLHEKGTSFRAHQMPDGDGTLLEQARLPAAIEDVA